MRNCVKNCYNPLEDSIRFMNDFSSSNFTRMAEWVDENQIKKFDKDLSYLILNVVHGSSNLLLSLLLKFEAAVNLFKKSNILEFNFLL